MVDYRPLAGLVDPVVLSSAFQQLVGERIAHSRKSLVELSAPSTLEIFRRIFPPQDTRSEIPGIARQVAIRYAREAASGIGGEIKIIRETLQKQIRDEQSFIDELTANVRREKQNNLFLTFAPKTGVVYG